MTIPLDRLYSFIQNTAETARGDSVLIYRFYPHGSKNIDDLKMIRPTTWAMGVLLPHIYCNDQEPLNYKLYCDQKKNLVSDFWKISKPLAEKYYVRKTQFYCKDSVFQRHLLLHSEQRSKELDCYNADNELIPVYYWNHALLSLDWFRYAQLEKFNKDIKKTFLIYNRAWSGTREYRLKFADMLIENSLLEHCQISMNPIDPESQLHYHEHDFVNPDWRPKNILENFYKPTQADSGSSADFVTEDYCSTMIEVVLETLFDDTRLHLTEKSLRPIACGQPFLLVGAQGSLEYLRGYGFKTYDCVWNENYDLIHDPVQRLQAVQSTMCEIVNWNLDIKKDRLRQAQEIADYNRKWFFSQEFFDNVVNELKQNLKCAFDQLDDTSNYQYLTDLWQTLLSHQQIVDFLNTNQNPFIGPTWQDVHEILNLSNQNQGDIKSDTIC
jgi:hypothetical protein